MKLSAWALSYARIPFAAHRTLDVQLFQAIPILLCSVLAATIRVVDQTGAVPTAAYRCGQGRQRQLRVQMPAHGIPHHPSGPCVQDDRQEELRSRMAGYFSRGGWSGSWGTKSGAQDWGRSARHDRCRW